MGTGRFLVFSVDNEAKYGVKTLQNRTEMPKNTGKHILPKSIKDDRERLTRILGKVHGAMSLELESGVDRTNAYSRGLSVEGWSGGYLAALDDVMLMCNGVLPDRWRGVLLVGGKHGKGV